MKTPPEVGERFLLSLLPKDNTKGTNPKKNLTAKKTRGWGFLLVLAVGRVCCPTDLVGRNYVCLFSVGRFLLYNFTLTLIDPEHHG